MTILIEQQFKETKPQEAEENNEVVLDGGFPLPKPTTLAEFVAPDINSYGHSFR